MAVPQPDGCIPKRRHWLNPRAIKAPLEPRFENPLLLDVTRHGNTFVLFFGYYNLNS